MNYLLALSILPFAIDSSRVSSFQSHVLGNKRDHQKKSISLLQCAKLPSSIDNIHNVDHEMSKIAEIAAGFLDGSGRLVHIGLDAINHLPFYAQHGLDSSKIISISDIDGTDNFIKNVPLIVEQNDLTIRDPSKVQCIVRTVNFGETINENIFVRHAYELLDEGGLMIFSYQSHRDPAAVRCIFRNLVRNMSLQLVSYEDDTHLHGILRVVLKRVRCFFLEKLIFIHGTVGTGFGRGGKKLGVPTANLKPEGDGPLRRGLANLPTGVYVGWAKVDSTVFKAVVNIGFSPTFAEQNPEKIVEAHLIDYNGKDFYGQEMNLLLLGFIRSEKKFDSFSELLSAIREDILETSEVLDCEPYSSLKNCNILLKSHGDSSCWVEYQFDELLAA